MQVEKIAASDESISNVHSCQISANAIRALKRLFLHMTILKMLVTLNTHLNYTRFNKLAHSVAKKRLRLKNTHGKESEPSEVVLFQSFHPCIYRHAKLFE